MTLSSLTLTLTFCCTLSLKTGLCLTIISDVLLMAAGGEQRESEEEEE